MKAHRVDRPFNAIEVAKIQRRTDAVITFKAMGRLLLAEGMAPELLYELINLLIVEHTHEE